MADDDDLTRAEASEPHTEKEFGRFDRTLRKHAPRQLGELARTGRQLRAVVGSRARGKRR